MNKGKITYYYDALCGWCYGFSSVMSQLHHHYKDDLTFDVVSGGLFLGNRVGPINEIAPYIKEGAYKTVESTTGVTFGEKFLKKLASGKDLILDSHLAAVAMSIVKDKKPEESIKFSSLLKKAVYDDGINPVEQSAYSAYAAEIGIEAREFNKSMSDELYHQKALKEFEDFSKNSSSGFPTVTLTVNQNEVIIARGYTPFNELKERLDYYLS